MQQRVFDHPKIDVKWNSVVDEYLGDPMAGGLVGVNLKDTKTGEITKFDCDGAFVAIGHKPNSSLVDDVLELDSTGFIITQPGTSITSVSGVFAAGDIQDSKYMQAITAAGSGCQAALDAERYIEEKEL